MKSSPSTILGIGLPLSVTVALAVPFLGACSSGSTTPSDAGTEVAHHDSSPPVDTGPPPCDPSKCYPGNKCIADAKGIVGCQRPCGAQFQQTPPAGQSACPFNTTCTTIPAGTPAGSAERSICTLDKTQYNKSNPGVWGAPCNPTGGIEMNPDCDTTQNFWCYARNPTDGNAYCTQYSCKSDADCRGGWWCATVNVGPNAGSNPKASEIANRSTGATINVCQPRNYCASCKTDLDCDSFPTGVIQHCIADHNGTRSYCAPECSKTGTESQAQADGECNSEAQCVLLDQSNYCQAGSTCVCASRARECIGDGLLCSPCLSDADCKPGGGLCLNADYSTEHFCSVPSGPKAPKCSIDSMMNLVADCPTTDEATNKLMGQYQIGCLTQADGYDPASQCVGLRTLGTYNAYGPDGGIVTLPLLLPGCWTPNQ
jgi:hypothetical protein